MNTEKVCRCCLALDEPLLSIYDGESAGMGCVADMLKQISILMPQPADNMPDKACLQCIGEINRCYVFKMKCENSNRILRQLLPEAVPDLLNSTPRKVLVASSAVQTDDKILVSSMAQTIENDRPIASHSSVQTDEEVKPFINHREMQTEYEISQLNEESYFIYEEIEKLREKTEKHEQSSPESKQMNKELCQKSSKTGDYLAIEDSDSNAQQISLYVLFEDSSYSGESEIENQKHSDRKRYTNEVNEFEDSEENNFISQHNDHSNERNFNMQNILEIESSEGKIIIKPRNEKNYDSKGQYKCSHCIMTFVSIEVLKKHLANMHDVNYLPSVDPGEISSNNAAGVHNRFLEQISEEVAKNQLMPKERTPSVNEELLINNFKCNVCGSIFVSEKKLEAHKLRHDNPHYCMECDAAYKTIEELNQHAITDHNITRNQCHLCKKVFKTRATLNNHLRTHSGERPFLCTICGKSFNHSSTLYQHLIRHRKEKKFKCDICSNGYVSKAELRSHRYTHTGDSPFKCDICLARFTTSCSLKNHLRLHRGERPYACEFCTMRFSTLNTLKNHRRTHTGERPFQCAHCPKRFKQKGVCYEHERTHTKEDFKCFCDSKFLKKSNLKSHIRRKHPNLGEKEIQALLFKTVDDNDNEQYKIKSMESNSDDNNAFVAISEEREAPNNNEEFLEIAMEDVG